MMTAPRLSVIRYQGKNYKLSGSTEVVGPHPEEFGIKNLNMESRRNDWKGYSNGYAIIKEQLFLTHLTLYGHIKDAPKIDGKRPRWRFTRYGDTEYRGLNYAVNYTGKLLLVAEFVSAVGGTGLRLGFYRPYMCRYVYELFFDDGFIIDEIDHSDHMENLRQFLRERPRLEEMPEYLDLPSEKDPDEAEDDVEFQAWLKEYLEYHRIKDEIEQAELREWAAQEYGPYYDAWWLCYVP